MGSRPSAPTFNTGAAISEQNRVNQAVANQKYADVNGPTGGYSISVDPTTGQMTVNKVLSANSQQALDLQRQALGNYLGDNTDAEGAYYNSQMAYLNPQMQRQVARGESALTNRGIPIGGSAWNEAMGDIYDAQNQTVSSIGSAALSAGQGYKSGQLNQGAMLGSQIIDPSMVVGQGGAGYEDTYLPAYENEKARYKTAVANSNKWGQALGMSGSIIGGVIGGIYGGPMGAQKGAQAGGSAGSGWGGIIDNA